MIEIVNLSKKFDDRWIMQDINLSIPDGQITCIVGRSGAGKSVLLKQILGLLKPTCGNILINGTSIVSLSNSEQLFPVLKKCGYVFQFAALIDSLTVFENVALALFDENLNKEKLLDIVKEKLALVNLGTDILDKYPSELSGGMRKRIGIARTLVTNPGIILYDEPTTGLDPINARIVHELIYDVQRKNSVTSVIVSHDIEIFKYADNVALLDEGKIRFFGKAEEVWHSKNPYIYQFVRGLVDGPISQDRCKEIGGS
jgi:phospholipid/cholesterol/gamma-HCH transport system ATP-binding protein